MAAPKPVESGRSRQRDEGTVLCCSRGQRNVCAVLHIFPAVKLLLILRHSNGLSKS